MQPVGPYRFIEAISVCQVGSVWSAIDGQGNSFTAAVLDAAVATDKGWRDAFAGTAHALAQPGGGGSPFAHADLTATAPWIAYAAAESAGAEQLFSALGMQCQPLGSVTADDESVTVKNPLTVADPVASAQPDTPDGLSTGNNEELVSPTTRLAPTTNPPGGPWQAGPGQSSGASPVSVPPHQTSGPPHQVSVPPHQISVPPEQTSGPPMPLPEMPGTYPASGPPSPDPSGYDPLYSPVRHIVPSEPAPSRRRLWILVSAAVVLVLAVGGTVFAIASSGDDPPAPPQTTQAASSAPAVPMPTSSPLAPGKEPPKDGTWRTDWPKFTETYGIRTFHLEGLAFPIRVPQAWQCSTAEQASGYTRVTCGIPPGQGPDIGGEIIVRRCEPCDGETRFAMRKAEEAWGLQWVRPGPTSLYAESFQLQGSGERRYGLVMMGFFRSDTAVDSQLVLRMTSPVDGAGQIRRVANYLHDVLVF